MTFKDWQDYRKFAEIVKNKNRFIHAEEVVNFLNTLRDDLCSREVFLQENDILYRSQFGYTTIFEDDYQRSEGHPKERMIPTSEYSREGRANPKGITYLYLSDDMETSMSEMRPHVGQWLSCAQFKIVKRLRLLDCHSNEKEFCLPTYTFSQSLSQSDFRFAVWYMINEAFSLPINNSDTSTDYVPTQILAEWFKSQKYDGICHKSSIGKGLNYILFDHRSAEYVECLTVKTKGIKYEFEEGSPDAFPDF